MAAYPYFHTRRDISTNQNTFRQGNFDNLPQQNYKNFNYGSVCIDRIFSDGNCERYTKGETYRNNGNNYRGQDLYSRGDVKLSNSGGNSYNSGYSYNGGNSITVTKTPTTVKIGVIILTAMLAMTSFISEMTITIILSMVQTETTDFNSKSLKTIRVSSRKQ